MKKLIMLLIAVAFVFAPVGLNYDHADAAKKGYKSGTKTYDSNVTPKQNQTNQNVNATTNKSPDSPSKSTSVGKSTSKGLMKGLLYGGLAGLLFGALLGNLGILGSILGFMINMLAILFLFSLARKGYRYYKEQKRKQQEIESWKR